MANKLKMDESYQTIPGVFGVTDKKFDQVISELGKMLLMDQLVHQGTRVKTALLRDFLNSDEFKKIGWELKTENDYFLLGFAFHDTLHKTAEFADMLTEKVDRLMAEMDKNPKEALKTILKDMTDNFQPEGKFKPTRGGIPDTSIDSSVDKIFKNVKEDILKPNPSAKKSTKDEDLPN